MNTNIVERNVVEFGFDNSDFEKKTKESMSTIEKLKASLKFDKTDTFKGLQDAANNVNLNGLSSTLEMIQSKFSTLGIMGMTTISRLTNEIISGAMRAGKAVEDLIISGGIRRAENIERAKFQLSGLGIAWEDVSHAIDYAVTDTAYSLDAAAQAASQLSAAGLDYKQVVFTHEKDKEELTQMSMALKAVSGVAAQTQSDYSMVARYFQDVANAGKVTGSTLTYMTQVLNLPVEQNLAEGLKAIADGSFEASDAVKANAKKLVGTTEVSAEQVKEFCKKGLIDFDTFSTIMFNKYADHAGDANKTLEGVKANIRSAFAKIGAEFAAPLIANEGPLVKMLDQVRAKINGVRNEVKPLAKVTTDFVNEIFVEGEKIISKINVTGMFDDATYAAENLISALKVAFPEIKKIFVTIRNTYKDIFPKKTTENFKNSIDKIVSSVKKLKVSNKSLEKIKSIFSGIFSTGQLAAKVIKNVIKSIKPLLPYGNKVLTWITDVAAKIGDVITAVNKGTKSIEGLKDSANKFKDVLETIKWAFTYVFDILEGKYEGCQTAAEKFGASAAIVFYSVIDSVVSLVEALTGIDLGSLHDELFAFFENATDFVHKFLDKVEENGGGIKGVAATIWETIKELGRKFADWVKETTGIDLYKLKEKVEECAEQVKESFSGFLDEFKPLEKARDIVVELTDAITTLISTVKGGLGSALTGISKMLENPFLTLEALAKSDTFQSIGLFIKRISNQGLVQTLSGLSGPISTLQGALTSFKNNIKAQQLLTLSAGIIGFSIAIGILAVSVGKLAQIKDFDSILIGVGGTLALMIGLLGAFILAVNTTSNIFTKSNKTIEGAASSLYKCVRNSVGRIVAASVAMLVIAKAVGVMAEAVGSITKLDFGENSEKLLDSFIVIIGSLSLLILAFIGLNQLIKGLDISAKNIAKVLMVSYIFEILASATKTMAKAVSELQSMNVTNWKATLGSLFEVLGLMAGLVGVLNFVKVPNGPGFIKSAIALLVITYAVSELVTAINKLQKEDPVETLLGFGMVLLMLNSVLSSAFMISGRNISLKTSIGLIALSLSIAVLCRSIQKLAAMPIEEIGKGFIVLYGYIGTFAAIAVQFKKEMPGLIGAGFAMIEFAASLYIVSSAINKLAAVKPEQLAFSMGVLIGTIGVLQMLLKDMNDKVDSKSSVALIAMAAAIWVVSDALKQMAGLNLAETIVHATILVTVLGLMALIAEKISTDLKGAIGLTAIALGIAAVAAALSSLANTKGWAFAAVGAIVVLVAALGGLAFAAQALAAPLLAGGAVIAGFMALVALGVSAIGGSLLILGLALGNIAASVAAASEGLSLLGDVVIKLGVSFAMNKGPINEFAATLFKMVAISFTLGAGFAVLGVGSAAAAIGVAALAVAGLALAAALAALGASLKYVLDLLNVQLKAEINSTAPYMEDVGKGITGYIAKGITSNSESVKSAAKGVAKDTKDAFNSEMGISSPSKVFMESGKFIDMGLAQGITSNTDIVTNASTMLGQNTSKALSTELVKGTNNGTKQLEESMKIFAEITGKGSESAGANVGIGFAKGLSAIAPKIKQYAANLAKSAMASMRSYLKIKSPSRVAMEIGEYTGEGFAIGMGNTTTNVEDSAEDLGKTAEQSLTTALSAAYNNLTSDVTDPTIKPVLDLSEIQNGASSIDSMLSRDYASNIAASYKSDRQLANEERTNNESLMNGLNDKLVSAIMSNDMSNLPINLNVQLVGDADGIFRLVLGENNRRIAMYGSSPLMRG